MTEEPRRFRALQTVLRHGSILALLVVVLSLALRFSVRDRIPALAVVYFGTPLVLDAVAAAAAAVISWRFGRKRIAAFAAVLAVVCGALHVHGSFLFNEPGPPGAIRGVFWNVEGGRAGWTELAEKLASFDADVMWLAETGSVSEGADDALRARFPQHTLLRANGGLVVLVRGRAELAAWVGLPQGGRMAMLEMETKGHAFRTAFADVGAHLAPRRATLGVLFSVATSNLGQPLLVLGDLNTPRDSVEFDEWRGSMQHAFETVGRGLDATWPVPVPVLSLDHVWSGGGLRVRTCELPWTTMSDHLPVVFTFDVP